MNHLECPNCGQSVRGVVVTFPMPDVRKQVENTLVSDFRHLWRLIDDRRIWFQLKFLYDCLPYWNEFYDLSKWDPQWANMGLDGELKLGDSLTWDALLSMKPKLFVEDIIQSGRIRMMMQPIVDIAQGRVMGYEMLARVLQTDGTIISPGELYSSAREQNQLFRLDRACRIAAIEAATVLQEDMLIFVNFIPTSIYVPQHCLATTLATVMRLGFPRARIVFEVVETDRVQDLQHLQKILSYYRETGFQCALDDFGEGFSDIQTMNALQPNIIKLDRKYVSDIDKIQEKRTMAEVIYRQGTAIGATMLAEGIESEAEAIVLAKIGYHLQQGYWYGRPTWEPIDVDADKLRSVQQVI